MWVRKGESDRSTYLHAEHLVPGCNEPTPAEPIEDTRETIASASVFGVVVFHQMDLKKRESEIVTVNLADQVL
jgi:hypothetical protein